jgi:hypothetical protein
MARCDDKYGAKKISPNVIYVIEEEPPKGIEPIEWFLMTNEEVESAQTAYEKVEFWEWVALWGCVVKTPGDLGFSDEGYILPELKIIQHIVKTNNTKIMKDGREALFEFEYAKTLNERRQAKRNSLNERIQKAAEIANSSNEQVLLWCDLNSESAALKKVIDDAIEVKGSDTTEHMSCPR